MSDLSWIGTITLNASFVLYLIMYIPQIIHNQKTKNILQLSLWLHFLLYISYSFDLIYGFVTHLPWQYKTVSIVGVGLLTVQHLQLLKSFIVHGSITRILLNILFLALNTGFIIYVFMMMPQGISPHMALFLGTISRGFGLIYCLPQIIKNKYSQSAQAISVYFIYLNIMLALLDTVSAWCLDWGWPNKLASPVNILMMSYILWQIKKYKGAVLRIPQRLRIA